MSATPLVEWWEYDREAMELTRIERHTVNEFQVREIGTRQRKMFRLCGYLKAKGYSAPFAALCFKWWYLRQIESCAPMRETRWEVIAADFQAKWQAASPQRKGKRRKWFTDAVERARADVDRFKPFKALSPQYRNHDIAKSVSLWWHLWQAATANGETSVYLSKRDAPKMIGVSEYAFKEHTRDLKLAGILETVKQASAHRATRYRVDAGAILRFLTGDSDSAIAVVQGEWQTRQDARLEQAEADYLQYVGKG